MYKPLPNNKCLIDAWLSSQGPHLWQQKQPSDEGSGGPVDVQGSWSQPAHSLRPPAPGHGQRHLPQVNTPLWGFVFTFLYLPFLNSFPLLPLTWWKDRKMLVIAPDLTAPTHTSSNLCIFFLMMTFTHTHSHKHTAHTQNVAQKREFCVKITLQPCQVVTRSRCCVWQVMRWVSEWPLFS